MAFRFARRAEETNIRLTVKVGFTKPPRMTGAQKELMTLPTSDRETSSNWETQAITAGSRPVGIC